MIMINSITTSLQAKMTNKNLEGINFYLFGSIVHSDHINDIDLLIEYDKNIVSIQRALKLRKEIAKHIKKEFKVAADICLLSSAENNQSQFIIKEKGVLLLQAKANLNQIWLYPMPLSLSCIMIQL